MTYLEYVKKMVGAYHILTMDPFYTNITLIPDKHAYALETMSRRNILTYLIKLLTLVSRI